MSVLECIMHNSPCVSSGHPQELADPSPAQRLIRRRVGLLVAANVERMAGDDPVRCVYVCVSVNTHAAVCALEGEWGCWWQPTWSAWQGTPPSGAVRVY